MTPPRTTPALERPQPAQVRVVGVRPLSDRAFAVRVERPRGFDFPATRLAALHAGGERRVLTIASAPSRPYLEFATLRGVSPFKTALANLRPGDQLGLRGPHGRFDLDPSRPAAMLAGHIGIGAMKALLEHAVDQGLDLEGGLLHGHPEGDAPYEDELRGLAPRLPRFRFDATTAQGLGDARRIAALAPAGATYYLAGAPSEVAAGLGALAELGVDGNRVRVELFHGYR